MEDKKGNILEVGDLVTLSNIKESWKILTIQDSFGEVVVHNNERNINLYRHPSSLLKVYRP